MNVRFRIMKKLILLLVIFYSLFCTAQEPQVIREYNQVIATNAAGEKGEWSKINSKFIYNHKKITAYIGDTIISLTQVSETVYGTTENGTEYAATDFIDDESGEKITLQLFKDERFGVTLHFFDDTNTQFAP